MSRRFLPLRVALAAACCAPVLACAQEDGHAYRERLHQERLAAHERRLEAKEAREGDTQVASSQVSDAPALPGVMSDYMMLSVCTLPGGGIDPVHAPGEAGCSGMRQLRPGETPPFFTSDFPANGRKCAGGGGPVAKFSVPVERQGVTRVVSFFSHKPEDTGCAGGSGKMGASIEWHDDQYGFTMGSWSPAGLSNFISPLCQTNAGSSHSFYRGWTLAPEHDLRPGSGVFDSKLSVGHAEDAMGACPVRFHPGFTAWSPARFTFRSGKTLDAMVSEHYASASRDHRGPGESKQIERTYWTREYGLSRWEKWGRDDWSSPHSNLGVREQAAQLAKSGTCNAPWLGAPDATPMVQRSPGNEPGVFSEVHVDPATGTRHTWYLTLCEDYTNITHRPPTRMMPEVLEAASPTFWR